MPNNYPSKSEDASFFRILFGFMSCFVLGAVVFYFLIFYLEALSGGDKPIIYLSYRPMTLVILPFTLAIGCCLIGMAQDSWQILKLLPSRPRPRAYDYAIKLIIGGVVIVVVTFAVSFYMYSLN
ncbi:hypothetical protein [Herpetosiphon llansteffanensis]|uniref:hypothetical protein n=1 Tax=Herpetosiphon llansteffanensis TaxID=2094568 RepID=UPI000D7BE307|nr:hypothetical protein [Herpetosiphon llansteffanensis]